MAHQENPPTGFDAPTQFPATAEEHALWQEVNTSWWEKHPMRYDWRDDIRITPGSREFFSEIDKRFFEAARTFMPWKGLPFDSLIDFNSLPSKDVLEIGVGCGSHAGLLAKRARSFVGIDITDYAVNTTRQRLGQIGANCEVVKMNAEHLEFPANSFDFIWTWGVIHHSSDTRNILAEMSRVLRPGGKAVTMVYNRGIWNYYICHGLLRGLLTGELFRWKSIHKTAQMHTDGGIARYFTAREWRELASATFDVEETRIYGSKAELIPLPGKTRLKAIAMKLIPDPVGRLLTNRLRMGSFLVSTLRKP